MAQDLSVADQNTLFQLKQAGSDLSKPHEIDHWLYFKTRAEADSAATDIKARGFLVTSIVETPKLEWQVLAHKRMILTNQAVAASTSALESIAASHHGDYDGWETKVMK